jgi:hypothetical protein
MRYVEVIWGAAAGLLVLAGALDASAGRVSFIARGSGVIEGPDGVGRILIDFDGLESLEGKGISAAHLSIPLTGEPPSEDIDLQAFGLDTIWRGRTTSWTTPWRTEGGDLGYESGIVTLENGVVSGSIRLNVTQIVRGIVMRGAPSNGFLVTTPRTARDGLLESERALFGDFNGAVLTVTYVNSVPPSMRSLE